MGKEYFRFTQTALRQENEWAKVGIIEFMHLVVFIGFISWSRAATAFNVKIHQGIILREATIKNYTPLSKTT